MPQYKIESTAIGRPPPLSFPLEITQNLHQICAQAAPPSHPLYKNLQRTLGKMVWSGLVVLVALKHKYPIGSLKSFVHRRFGPATGLPAWAFNRPSFGMDQACRSVLNLGMIWAFSGSFLSGFVASNMASRRALFDGKTRSHHLLPLHWNSTCYRCN